jgi:hypothetical protein
VWAPRVPLVEARTQVLHVVVACWVGAVAGLLGLEVLLGVHLVVAEHGPAVYAVVCSVVAMHCAVESMVGRSGLFDA